ncbi:MAG: lipopolysaccharide heptosyltransferase I [Oleibacter sp.]|nr:lipopolysaccharide heptosyltransferase I [Thalassolituus sp.]
MKVLLIKTSSLGDVFHTLPAINDAAQQCPDIEFHWVVEEAFAAIPTWHPAVKRVIPMAWRRWRKQLRDRKVRSEMNAFRSALRDESYDLVLDAQGLLKSAVITRMARGHRVGLDKLSAREGLSALAYQTKLAVPRGQHAIDRVRQLFSQALDYDIPEGLDYGVDRLRWQRPTGAGDYWVFLHGTTWDTKLWPETYWRELAQHVCQQGERVYLPWGNPEEQARAGRIAHNIKGAEVLPKMGLNELNAWLAHASAVVGVDTGLSHVVAALGVPAVAIYGATDATLTGVCGPQVTVLSSERHCAPCLSKVCLHPDGDAIQPPCFKDMPPLRVFEQVQRQRQQ